MLVESLFAQAAKHPTDIAITDDRGPMTWQQLAGAVTGLSMYLAQQTTQPRVGILLPASAGFVASFYGTLLAGKTAVPCWATRRSPTASPTAASTRSSPCPCWRRS
jgi:acyl-CoA synthetase (AMP-forming)/AMP-acid ligase II